MEKPISLILEEFKINITNLINESRLHPAILDMVMTNIVNEVHELAVKQAYQENVMYEQQLKEQRSTEESE